MSSARVVVAAIRRAASSSRGASARRVPPQTLFASSLARGFHSVAAARYPLADHAKLFDLTDPRDSYAYMSTDTPDWPEEEGPPPASWWEKQLLPLEPRATPDASAPTAPLNPAFAAVNLTLRDPELGRRFRESHAAHMDLDVAGAHVHTPETVDKWQRQIAPAWAHMKPQFQPESEDQTIPLTMPAHLAQKLADTPGTMCRVFTVRFQPAPGAEPVEISVIPRQLRRNNLTEFPEAWELAEYVPNAPLRLWVPVEVKNADRCLALSRGKAHLRMHSARVLCDWTGDWQIPWPIYADVKNAAPGTKLFSDNVRLDPKLKPVPGQEHALLLAIRRTS